VDPGDHHDRGAHRHRRHSGAADQAVGKAYAADVFRANPRTGKSYLVLMDFAYYMIFGAYILFVIKWEPDQGWDEEVNAEQLQGSVARIGGMILLMVRPQRVDPADHRPHLHAQPATRRGA